MFLVGGWRWPHSNPNSPTPPPRPGNTEAPHQGHLPALNQHTYDQEERAKSIEGLPWRALGRGRRVVVPWWLFFEITHWGTLVPYQWYPRSGSHCTQAVQLDCSHCERNSSANECHTSWLGLFDCAGGAECMKALGTQPTASVTQGHPGSLRQPSVLESPSLPILHIVT